MCSNCDRLVWTTNEQGIRTPHAHTLLPLHSLLQKRISPGRLFPSPQPPPPAAPAHVHTHTHAHARTHARTNAHKPQAPPLLLPPPAPPRFPLFPLCVAPLGRQEEREGERRREEERGGERRREEERGGDKQRARPRGAQVHTFQRRPCTFLTLVRLVRGSMQGPTNKEKYHQRMSSHGPALENVLRPPSSRRPEGERTSRTGFGLLSVLDLKITMYSRKCMHIALWDISHALRFLCILYNAIISK